MSTTASDEINAENQTAAEPTYDCYEQRPAELAGGSVAVSGERHRRNRNDAEAQSPVRRPG